LLKAHDIDGDGDGVPDAEDKCPSDANTDQLDGDDTGDLFTSVGCQTLLVTTQCPPPCGLFLFKA
ncbi:MAG: hypothetical protein P8J17_16545, partial [Halioglobus sp.]|nr:hypothetical protein [Halioglobus sp.]